ncbi:unnamed protein product [Diamesa serratosioi]
MFLRNKISMRIKLNHISLIEELSNQLLERDALISKLLQENEALKLRINRYKSNKKLPSKIKNNNNSPALNNIQPALIITPIEKPKTEICCQVKEKRKSIDSSEDDDIFNKKSIEESQHIPSIKLSNKNLFLMTDKPYIINDWKTFEEVEDEEIQKSFDEEINLEIPRWSTIERELSPVDDNSNIQIEDLNDEVFLKRHLKWEIDERRRKKWDVQSIREQKNIERLKKRHLKEQFAAEYAGNDAKIPKIIKSFFPDTTTNLKFIQIADDLPVVAFGEQIPKLQPKDFSLPWLTLSGNDNSNIYSISNQEQVGNTSNAPWMKVRTKFITNSSRSNPNN